MALVIFDVFAVLVGVITVLCILLNTIGVYAFLRMPRTPSNLVYLHLCFTDVIVGLFVTPFSILLLTEDLKVRHRELCAVQGVMFEISYTTTLLILTYISLDRLLALYQPLKYKELMSHRVLFWINVSTWIIPCIRPLLRYIISEINKDDYRYSNEDLFMVCYNSDYLNFVKGERVGTTSWTTMLDQCIIVISCQLATLVSSLLVVFKLSHRLHIKQKGIRNQASLHKVGQSAQQTKQPQPSSSTSEAPPPKKRIHHFHAAPESFEDTVQTSTGMEDTVVTQEGADDSLDDGKSNNKQQKIKRKRAAERHAIITMVTVIVFFMITYTPSFVCFLVPGIYPTSKTTTSYLGILLIDYATFINSTFLPMVHFSRSNGFKRQLRLLRSRAAKRLRLLVTSKSDKASLGDMADGASATVGNTTMQASFSPSVAVFNPPTKNSKSGK